jgi:hypothetical protein
MKQHTNLQPTQNTRTPKADIITTMPQPRNIEQTPKKTIHAFGTIPLSKAEVFMQSRPGGQLETKNSKMKGAERRVSAQLQKKGTTSGQGRKALDGITAIMATSNKADDAADPATVKKRKQPGQHAVLITPTKKISKGVRKKAAGKHKPVKSGLAINNKKTAQVWVQARGLLELVQMIPKWTKYHLEEGNYFHQKQCKDCKESIGELFDKSKEKGIFYYCHMDNKVADLSFDDQEQQTTACACVLCLTCYYNREEKKKLASGKCTRSSGRGG